MAVTLFTLFLIKKTVEFPQGTWYFMVLGTARPPGASKNISPEHRHSVAPGSVVANVAEVGTKFCPGAFPGPQEEYSSLLPSAGVTTGGGQVVISCDISLAFEMLWLPIDCGIDCGIVWR